MSKTVSVEISNGTDDLLGYLAQEKKVSKEDLLWEAIERFLAQEYHYEHYTC